MTFWFKKVPFNRRLEDSDFMIEMQERGNPMEENTLLLYLLVHVFTFTRCIQVSQPLSQILWRCYLGNPLGLKMWNVMKNILHLIEFFRLQLRKILKSCFFLDGSGLPFFHRSCETLLAGFPFWSNESSSWRDLWIFVFFCFCSRFPEDQCIVYRGFLKWWYPTSIGVPPKMIILGCF